MTNKPEWEIERDHSIELLEAISKMVPEPHKQKSRQQIDRLKAMTETEYLMAKDAAEEKYLRDRAERAKEKFINKIKTGKLY